MSILALTIAETTKNRISRNLTKINFKFTLTSFSFTPPKKEAAMSQSRITHKNVIAILERHTFPAFEINLPMVLEDLRHRHSIKPNPPKYIGLGITMTYALLAQYGEDPVPFTQIRWRKLQSEMRRTLKQNDFDEDQLLEAQQEVERLILRPHVEEFLDQLSSAGSNDLENVLKTGRETELDFDLGQLRIFITLRQMRMLRMNR